MPTIAKPKHAVRETLKSRDGAVRARAGRAGSYNARVDAYIAAAAPFAQPILNELRAMLHEAVPGIVEDIKWSRPFLSLNGQLIAHLSAFKAHCGFGFWSPDMTAVLANDGITGASAAGSFGRITSLQDLPPRQALLRYMKHAGAMALSGEATSPVASRPRASAKAPIQMPPEFAALLKRSRAATRTYEAFPPSSKREYLEWITTAKRPETRERRMAEAITRMEAGKRFNDEYRSAAG